MSAKLRLVEHRRRPWYGTLCDGHDPMVVVIALDRLVGAEDAQFPAAADPEPRRGRCPAACLPLTLDEGGLP